MNLLEQEFIFLDLQTTGSTPESGNILEIAWAKGSALDTAPSPKSFLVRQPDDQTLPPRIEMLTGIRNDDLHCAILPETAAELLLNDINEATWFGIHYARFEDPFLRRLMAGNLSVPVDENGDVCLPILCFHQIALRIFPDLPSRSIRALSGRCGYVIAEEKRAAPHVIATWHIWTALSQLLLARGLDCINDVQEWLAVPVKRNSKKRLFFGINKDERLNLPDKPGIYRMIAGREKVLYVGKATSLKSRVNSYFRGCKGRDPRKAEMLTQVSEISFTECATPLEAALMETDEIKKLNPPYNVSLKQKKRRLVFWNGNFSSSSHFQDAEHQIGPFCGDVMLPLVRFAAGTRDGAIDPLVFYGAVEFDELNAGFQEFCLRHALTEQQLCSVRSLLALGMIMLRRMSTEVTEDESDPTETNRTDLVEESPLAPEEHVPLTPEEVADKLDRLLMRSARQYLQSKVLTKLLDATVQYAESNRYRVLTFRSGMLAEQSDAVAESVQLTRSDHDSLDQRCHWKFLDIDAYDRMRVLRTEIARLNADGCFLKIQPRLTPLALT